ncbi:DNA alkylation repair protein [Motiliproteus sp. MSK22-1]|uniref:DNA alkylation repair protein n=1 Tax=Motiliproteus sp. MSK22-1 TaxID=1897630 RepID=UPI000975AAED|nr:DNA alkylation repair protein [Motiliproteus sp. MSK22-1]OMH30803.1 hypothetical protein BGP75_17405 [Motiliproteus sp. MSK22-1]
MAELLKNGYNRAYMAELARAVQSVHPSFDRQAFIDRVFDQHWTNLELKGRMQHIRHCLNEELSLPYEQALVILMAIAPRFGGFEAMLLPDYVEAYGIDDWSSSMKALEWFTRYSSSEFAVRPFILKDPQRMMEQMLEWSKDSDEHVRRLATEGCRPRLPWAQALPMFKQDPSAIFPVIEQLKVDPSEYVRRSVANNLNDIAKDHPQRVLDWAEENIGQREVTDWIIKHGCRTLLRQANARALKLFGFADPSHVEVRELVTESASVEIGQALTLSFKLLSQSKAIGLVRVEYGIEFVKANGKTSVKWFQVSETTIPEKQKVYQRQHSFRQMSTRTHYAGTHQLKIRINGDEKASVKFAVVCPDEEVLVE